MRFHTTDVAGAFRIEPRPFEDDRGYFMRAYCRNDMRDAGIDLDFIQANLAGSMRRGTLRGLHYQAAPHEEGKLVRCIRGAIFDVVVDIRPDSETFGCWAGVELSDENRQMLYIPPGCAHGYLTLADQSEVYYLVSAEYAPEAERGIRWDDPAFAIDWPITEDLILSDKDRAWPPFKPETTRS